MKQDIETKNNEENEMVKAGDFLCELEQTVKLPCRTIVTLL